MRLALYARVSTTDQTVEPQLHALREYAERRGLDVVAEYVDHGQSGAKDRRPALDQLVAAARVRAFDAVAVVKLDRLARSVRHLVVLAGEWQALGVDLIVLDQGVDSSTPSGKLLFTVLAGIAEFERDLIRERTAAGLQAARRRGRKLGRPESLTAQDRARAGRLRSAGASHRAIARQLGCSHSTVRRALAGVEQKPHRRNGHSTAATSRIGTIQIPG
jgi:DNA invertase Pin-like site-specific DNA recombinase